MKAKTVLYLGATWNAQYDGPPDVGYREASSPSDKAMHSFRMRITMVNKLVSESVVVRVNASIHIQPRNIDSCPPP